MSLTHDLILPPNLKDAGDDALNLQDSSGWNDVYSLEHVYIPKSLTSSGGFCTLADGRTVTIHYEGTEEEFREAFKDWADMNELDRYKSFLEESGEGDDPYDWGCYYTFSFNDYNW